MSDRDWIEPIVERVVGQVLDSHASQLRSEIVRRVIEEITSHPASPAPSSASAVADLARAISDIQVGSSQKEILRSLLESGSRYATRLALFVVKGNHAAGWQARGFAHNDALKEFALDATTPAVVQALGDRVPANVPAAEFDTRFFEEFGTPSAREGRLLPLILKDKVAALVYADAGDDGTLDAGSLDVLVLATGAWLEVNALRKQVHKAPSAASSDASATRTAAPASQSFNDPFAAHTPAYAMAAAASGDSPAATAHTMETVEAQGAVVEVQSAVAESQVVAEPLLVGNVHASTALEAPVPDVPSPTNGVDGEVHRKAQRFARLLVDEIKLYNQAKVSAGRDNHDLYDRLKDAIEKSRATYQKRYGNTVAASSNYFEHEVVRSLAEDDLKIMGPNFHL